MRHVTRCGAAALFAAYLWLGIVPMCMAENPAITVGNAVLAYCGAGPRYCGQITRKFDPLDRVPGAISVGFEYYPPRGHNTPQGVLVATEGGPGYPARESRDDYLALFAPLRDRFAVLIMDNRGTGSSGAIDCPDLQRADSSFTVEAVAACGRQLGDAAFLYSSAYAADDLAAVLDELRVDKVALYGDSYGTFLAQTFVYRHPSRVTAVVLDGAYPLNAPDAGWVPSYAPAMRDKFDLACSRDKHCRGLEPPGSGQFSAALRRLRDAPSDTKTLDAQGQEVAVHADATALATTLFGSAPALTTLRESMAAATAYATADARPLLRLFAESRSAVDSRDPTFDPRLFSAGLAAAVMCTDAPQVYDMRSEPPQRRERHERMILEREQSHPDAYAPFTYAEFRAMPLDYAFIDECVLWPAIDPQREASLRTPADADFPDVAVLVLSGELDNMTSVAEGARAAAHFRHGQQVILKNSLHVNALPRARSRCGAILARRWLLSGQLGDDSCKDTVVPVRLVPAFSRRVDDLDAARPLPGNATDSHGLRVATGIVATISDAIARSAEGQAGHSIGLRGGHVRSSVRGDTQIVTLEGAQFTEDLAIDGTITVSVSGISGELVLRDKAGSGHSHFAWRSGADASVITGMLAGKRLHVSADAPYL